MKKFLFLFLAMMICVCACSCSKTEDTPLQTEDIKSICELATVKCYYNNVAKMTKEKNNVLQKNRKMWIEYEGEATIGIDMSEVDISINDSNVIISMPESKVLSYSVVTDSFKYVSSADGWLFKNKITAEEEQAAIKEAQKNMKVSVKNNKAVFAMADKKAKELIENYIETVGKQCGVTYSIQWK